ncbi:hypothetical protein BK720_01030 [Bacillus thuringiensis serovar brasilensis]|uniref:HNH endonuclease n=1 Tax=Bacillus cereus group TaxID=86661 RepID=UPI000A3C624F|nr:HNH endonuclease [Bacillus thuringiensis]MCU5031650.1 HNH endonuclease [Bacillus cereus]MRA74595.1 hypothetical protein [Bacillus thuringiensis]MRA92458.1 hypothetical protein [Bacillus thuringiensis]MRC54745.1 hypothetical protein [Bacillus thuringiensis]OTX38933.1 hypothetical protein BK720_01030 [Bacillus thuringiensis serovar brasilensis]
MNERERERNMIPNNISKDNIINAIYSLDRNGIHPKRMSTKFELLFNGKRYPPKEVLREANYIANKDELWKFGGGDESNNFLIKSGFDIVLKGKNEKIKLDYTKNKRNNKKKRKISKAEKDFIEEINKEISRTEKLSVIKGRIGQSTFKNKLLQRQSGCAVCGIEDKRFLIASHIKPWRDCTDFERLDDNNGLLLCPNHDWLFDKGFITFDNDGRIILVEDIDKDSQKVLGISRDIYVKLSKIQVEYLNWHQKNIFQKTK